MSKTKSKSRVKRRVRYRDPEFLRQLGIRIKQVRTSRGYSIDRLALETEHFSRATISRIETAKSDPQASTLKRIAEGLGVSLSFLLDFTRNS